MFIIYIGIFRNGKEKASTNVLGSKKLR